MADRGTSHLPCHIDICPQQAFTGRSFGPDEPRDARFDAAAGDRYFRGDGEGTGCRVCGLCRSPARTGGDPACDAVNPEPWFSPCRGDETTRSDSGCPGIILIMGEAHNRNL